MGKTKIVVWDNIGNVLLGVQPWGEWPAKTREELLTGEPAARPPSFDELFAPYGVDLVWLYNQDRAHTFVPQLSRPFGPNLRPVGGADDVAAAVEDADYVVLHKEQLSAEVLRRAGRLRLIQHLGQDYRGIPVEVARERGIPVAAVPLTNYLAVAEHTWALILNHLRRLPAQRAHVQGRRYGWGSFPGVQLARGLTVGLLGLGEIARPVARYARSFEMRTIYWDIARFPEVEAHLGVEFVGWDDLFRQADIVSLHLPLTPETQGLIGAREFDLMKPGALFVNTARGKIVAQGALVAALQAGRIGAALDVFAEEPLPPGDPLHELHERPEGGVALTTHSASQAPWTWVWDSLAVWNNVLRSLRGEPPEHLV